MGGILTIDGINVPVGTHETKKIIIGSDHRGFEYKSRITEFLKRAGYFVEDIGTYSTERCDYPAISDDIGRRVGKSDFCSVGIGICGSGIGILIPASKHRHVYVARCVNPDEARTSRRHNNTNVLGIGADCVKLDEAIATVNAWLTTPFYNAPEDSPYLKRYVQTALLEMQSAE